jgi:Fe-S-cluster containining protein
VLSGARRLPGTLGVTDTTVSERNAEEWALFKCHRCGKCCTEAGLPYDPEKIHDIAEYLGMTVKDVIDKYYGSPADDGQNWIPDWTKRRPCPFLKREGSIYACGIYPVRPGQCRAFPFDTDFGTGGVACPAETEVRLALLAKRDA